MREPKLAGPYPPAVPGHSPRFYVRWYDQKGRRQTKTFGDRTRAELFHQVKLGEHAGQPFNSSMVTLQKLTLIERAVDEFKHREDARVLELEAENTRLVDENDRLRTLLLEAGVKSHELEAEIKSLSDKLAERSVGGPINTAAVRWAYGQKGLTGTCRMVLIAVAMHADRNYLSWPSALTISQETAIHRETVGIQLTELLRKAIICDIGRRGQVKVFKLMIPKGAGNPSSLTCRIVDRKSVTNEERGTTTRSSKDNLVVVGGAQPDENRDQLYALAAAATNFSELVEKLKPYFPSHNVDLEKREYLKHRNRHERPITARTFVTWMLRADIRLSPPKPKHKPPAPAPIPRPPEHEEEIDPERHGKFLKELAEHKTRKAAKVWKASRQPE